jgi:hypothetical protein
MIDLRNREKPPEDQHESIAVNDETVLGLHLTGNWLYSHK